MKNKPNLATVVSAGLISVTLLSGLALSSSLASADNDSVVDQINITVPISCTLSGNGMTSHNAEINNGLYEPNIGTTTLHAFCNDNEGFAIYAAGYTGNEVGGINSNKLVGTTASNNATIDSGIATTAGNPDISNWAMKLAISQDSGDTTGTNAFTIDSAPNVDLPSEAESGATQVPFSSYHVVPNEYTKVAHKNSGTDMTATTGGVKLTTTYAAYISKTQAADTYSGQVIYTLVHPSSAAAPLVCAPNGTTISTIVCMQDISSTNQSAILSSMTEGVQYTLIDKRDEKTYTVSKLADGNIWMTQNLDLDLDSSRTYTNEDTDLGWNESTHSYDTASWSPERSTYTTGTTTWALYNSTTGDHDGYYHPESYDPGDLYWNGTLSNWSDWDSYYNSCTYDNDTWLYSNCDESLNPIATYTTASGTPTQQYHLGNFYNWSAAIASNDSSIYGVYDSGTGTYTNTETDQSICPAGWTLPIGGYFNSNAPSKSSQYLIEQYGWNGNNHVLGNDQKIWESPIYLGLSGYWYGLLEDVGYGVGSWSSVASDEGGAYNLGAYSDDYVNPDNDDNRYNGYAVRCVARDQSPIVSFDDVYEENSKTKVNNYYVMQDLDDSMCGSVSDGQVTMLIDTRDNNLYHVGKLRDGNCWMLDNLALDPTDSTTAANMNATNTNATSAAITNFLNGGSTTTGWSNTAVADVDSGFDSYTEPMINNASKDTLVTAFGPAANNGQSKTGLYYNYCAASIGTYCYPYDSGDEAVVLQDICPAGWRMPIGWGDMGEYYRLGMSLGLNYYAEDDVLYGNNILDYLTSLSNNFSGYYTYNSNDDNVFYRNDEGWWWSSSAVWSYGRVLRVHGDGYYEINPRTVLERNNGATMRCIIDH